METNQQNIEKAVYFFFGFCQENKINAIEAFEALSDVIVPAMVKNANNIANTIHSFNRMDNINDNEKQAVFSKVAKPLQGMQRLGVKLRRLNNAFNAWNVSNAMRCIQIFESEKAIKESEINEIIYHFR